MWRRRVAVAVARLVAVAVLLSLLASGCLAAEFLAPETETARSFSCAVLTADAYPFMVVRIGKETGVRSSVAGPATHLRTVLSEHSEKDVLDIELEIEADVVPPEGGWSEAAFAARAQLFSFQEDRRTVALEVLWIQAGLGGITGKVLAPGMVVVSQDAIRAKASQAGAPLEATAIAVLLHQVGHALGQVNDGIPMVADHEGSPKHDSDHASVMHEAWHDAATVPEGPPPQGYGADAVADWQTAIGEGGVCP